MYLYHANALGLGGTLIRPFQQTISAQASCSLPTTGGTGSSRVEKFNLNGLISFDSAQSDVAGGIEPRNGKDICVTRVSSVIENLNILNVLMADQVVLRMAAEHIPGEAEPRIITTGSHFDNLKIAGHPVEVEYAHDVFHDLPTYGHCQSAWSDPKAKQRVQDTLAGCQVPQPGADDPKHLHDVFDGYQKQKQSPTLGSTVLCSCVKQVKGINGTEIKNWGSVIKVPQFGTVYLGEVIMSHGHRRVNMFRLALGSPDGGTVVGGNGGSNGGTYP